MGLSTAGRRMEPPTSLCGATRVSVGRTTSPVGRLAVSRSAFVVAMRHLHSDHVDASYRANAELARKQRAEEPGKRRKLMRKMNARAAPAPLSSSSSSRALGSSPNLGFK